MSFFPLATPGVLGCPGTPTLSVGKAEGSSADGPGLLCLYGHVGLQQTVGLQQLLCFQKVLPRFGRCQLHLQETLSHYPLTPKTQHQHPNISSPSPGNSHQHLVGQRHLTHVTPNAHSSP